MQNLIFVTNDLQLARSLPLDLMFLYPGIKGNFKATLLFKETLTALNLLENILIALPRDQKHCFLKKFCCYHLYLTVIFYFSFSSVL